MANFCVGCGSPSAGQVGFCSNCGARTAQSGPVVAPVPAAVAPPAAIRKSSIFKWVAVVVGVLFFMAVLSVAGMYYTARRYVAIAENLTGVKAGDVVGSLREAASRSSEGATKTKRDGCLLLSKQEASAILGLEVERVSGTPNEQESGEHCDFFVKAETIEANVEKLKQAVDVARSEPNPDPQPNKLPPGAINMLKTFQRGVAEGVGNGEAPYLRLTVERENGRIAFKAFQIADRLGSGDLRGTSEPLSVGDQAAMGIGDSRLCVLKGNTAITLDLSQITDARTKGRALAQTILARL